MKLLKGNLALSARVFADLIKKVDLGDAFFTFLFNS